MSDTPENTSKTRLLDNKRVSPIKTLLNIKYFPLLVAGAQQCYVVGQWLMQGAADGNKDWMKLVLDIIFSIVGALGLEGFYIGAIAWGTGGIFETKGQRFWNGFWFWMVSLVALVGSSLVAFHLYYPKQQEWAFLHSMFPLGCFFYTMLIHSGKKNGSKKIILGLFETIRGLEANLRTIKQEKDTALLTLGQQWQEYHQRTLSHYTGIGENVAVLDTQVKELSVARQQDAEERRKLQEANTELNRLLGEALRRLEEYDNRPAPVEIPKPVLQFVPAPAADGGSVADTDEYRERYKKDPLNLDILAEAMVAGIVPGTLQQWFNRYHPKANGEKWSELAKEINTRLQAAPR
jgi:hypothetical protein